MSTSSSSSGVGQLVGRVIGHYRVTALIAQGGMGAVYEAHNTRLNRMVALKVMLPGMEASSEDVQRFLREAHAAARLSHPNLVPIYDVGDHHGVRYLALELVRGDTLHTLIRRRGQLPEAMALEIVGNCARGLQHAHEQGVLHRDLKPANIIVQQDGTPRVTDFGVAKAIGDHRLTATGTALGTPNYMSPEQAMGLNEELDARTDVYGLGAILYECLTGQPPFNESSHVATMNAVVNDRPRPPGKLREGLNEAIEAICLKCLNKNPSDRYNSTNELIVDIEACLRGRTVRADAAGVWRKFKQRVRRNALLGSLAVVCGLLFVAFLIALAIPTIQDRRVAQLERRARAALHTRLAQEASLLEQALASDAPGALEASLARLEPGALRTALEHALEPQGAEAERAVARGLEELEALARPQAAQASLRLATHRRGADQLDLWVRAELLDPDGPSGRRARLEQLRLLGEAPDAGLLLETELTELAATADELRPPALLELAALQASRWRWDEVARVLAALDGQDLEPEARERLAGLRWGTRLFGQAVQVPPYQLAAGLPGSGEARLVLGDSRELRFLGAPHGPEGLPQELLVQPLTLGASHLVAADLNGDGVSEAVMTFPLASEVQGAALWSYSPGAEASQRWTSLVERVRARVQDLVVGELDGEPGDDVLLLLRGVRPQLVLHTGGGASSTIPLDAINAWGTSAAALQDLDGDGIDELAVACTDSPAGIALFRYAAGRFEPLERPLELGRVVSVRAARGAEGRPLLLASVDFGGDDLDRAGAVPAGPSWRWRDGVYVVGWEADTPSLLARWTYGSEEQSTTRADAQRVQGLRAWSFEFDGETWLGRLASVAGEPVLETIRLASLSLEAPPAPQLRLPLSQRWSSFSGDVPALDIDGDGDDELLLGTSIGPLSEPVAEAWEAPPAQGSQPAERLQRVITRLLALEQPELAESRIATLAELSPARAVDARLAQIEASLTRAGQDETAAQRAFSDDAPELGRGLREASLARLRAAGEAALAVSQDAAAGPRPRIQAWDLAALAFQRACEEGRALEALREASASGLPAHLRDGVAQRVRALEAWSALQRLPLTAPETTVLASSLFMVRRVEQGFRLRCEPDTEMSLSSPLEFEEPLPLVLEATLSVTSGAWASSLELGLVEPTSDLSAGSTRELEAGFVLDLWNVKTGAPGVRIQAGGRSVGQARLAGFPLRLRLRLELSPSAGGTRVAYWVWAGEDLVHSAILERPRLDPPRRAFLAARSRRYPNEDGITVPPGFARGTWVTLEDLTLSTGHPIRTVTGSLSEVLLPQVAHGSMLGANRTYSGTLYQRLVSASSTPAQYVEGCLGAFAAGSTTRSWVLEALEKAPTLALERLEEVADALVTERPDLLPQVRAQLDEACRSEGRDVRLAAESLRGDHFQQAPPELNVNYNDLKAQLHRMQLRAFTALRPAQMRSNMTRFPQDEWVRMPLVRRIPSATPLTAAELEQLLGEASAHCLECRHDLLYRQLATASNTAAREQLAEAWRQLGYLGEWEQTVLETLSQGNDASRSQALWLELAEYHRSLGYLRPLEHDLRQLAGLGAPAQALEPFREALGAERFARAVEAR